MNQTFAFDPAETVLLVCLFFMMIASVRHYASRSPLPFEAWIVMLGLVYSQLHPHVGILPLIEFQPEIILLLILPLLIFAGGRAVHTASLIQVAAPITYLALFGVLFTAAFVGLTLAWLMRIDPLHGLLLGTALAATDPSAVGVILKRFPLPEKLLTTIEGESLLNDGLTIILFTTLAAIVVNHQPINLEAVAIHTLWVILAAVPLGWLMGWATAKVILAWKERNAFTGLTLTLVLAYGTNLIAEHLLHVSGIIAVLFAALAFVRCRYRPSEVEASHHNDTFQSFWAYIETLAGSLVFFMLGAAVGEHPFFITWIILGAILVVLLSRALLIYASALFIPKRKRWPLSWRHVFVLGSLRGAIPAALVLTLPADYIYRQTFLCLIFVVIIATLFLQPLMLKVYLKKSSVIDPEA